MNDSLLLQGWLEKEKHKPSIIGGNTNRRYFTIEAIEGTTSNNSSNDTNNKHNHNHNHNSIDGQQQQEQQQGELALCYYVSDTAKESSGWFFLADVESITVDTDGRWINVQHPTRCYRLRAPHRALHNLWYQTLTKLCYKASSSKEVTDNTSLVDQGVNYGGNQLLSGKTNIPSAGITERNSIRTGSKANPTVGNSRKNYYPDEKYNTSSGRDIEAEMNFLRNVVTDVEPTTTPSIEEEVAKFYPNHSHLDHGNEMMVEGDTYQRYGSVEAEKTNNARHLQYIGKSLDEEAERKIKRPFVEDGEVLDPSFTQKYGEDLPNYGNDIDASTWKEEATFRNEISPVPTPRTNYTPRWNYTDHRLRGTEEFSETDETIHKRLGRAILSADSADGYLCDGGDNTVTEDTENIMIVEEISPDDFNDDSNADKLPRSRYVPTKNSNEDKRIIFGGGMVRSGECDVVSNSVMDNRGIETVQYQDIPMLTNEGTRIVNSAQETKHPQLAEVIANDSDNDDTSVENDLVHRKDEEKSIASRKQKNDYFVYDDPDCSFLPDEDFVNEDWDD